MTNRKIALDPQIYRMHSMVEHNGDPDCDHDFDPRQRTDHVATWTCTKCGRKVDVEVWD